MTQIINFLNNQYDMYKKCGINKFFISKISYGNEGMKREFGSFKDYIEYMKHIRAEYTNKKMYMFELISPNRLCKPYLDVEYYLNLDNFSNNEERKKYIDKFKKKCIHKIRSEIIDIFKNHYNYDLNVKYIFISDASGPTIEDGYKISLHWVISTPDQVLYESNEKDKKNSAYHLAYLLKKTGKFMTIKKGKDISAIDTSVYK